MPWFKKDDDVPPELKDLDPKDVIAKIKENETLRAEKLTAEGNAANATTELERSRARILELEGNRNQPKPDDKKTGPTSVLLDEDQAFNERLGPTQAFAMQTASMVARMSVRDGLSKRDRYVWNKYEAEIDSLMEKEPLPRRVLPASWSAALTYIKGVHTDDLTKPDFFQETGTSEGGAPPIRTAPDDKLTVEEESICRKQKIDPKIYLEQRNAMRSKNRDWQPSQHS